VIGAEVVPAVVVFIPFVLATCHRPIALFRVEVVIFSIRNIVDTYAKPDKAQMLPADRGQTAHGAKEAGAEDGAARNNPVF